MPQVEDGYTRIANELLDALVCHPFSKRQYKVMLALVRKTYGYNKKSDAISYGKLSEATGLKRQHVIATVSELVGMGAIFSEKSGVQMHGGELNRLGVNKNYEDWVTSPETVTSHESGLVPKQEITSPKTGTPTSPKTVTHKRQHQKTNKRHVGHFEDFWSAYPNKVKKKPAKDIWKRKGLDAKAETLIADVQARMKRDKRWLDGYIPDPTTYLNQERWEDEMQGATKNNNGPSAGWEAF